MEHRAIGSLKVSVVGLGCNNFGRRVDEARTNEVVAAALDAGIDFFDTADVYGATKSEEFLGRALGARRNDVIIATKFGIPLDDAHEGGAKPGYIRRAVEDSLRRLGTDRIDLYQLHKPDPDVPIADTLGALDELVQQGKVREIGCSNFDAQQMQEARRAAKGARFVSVQNEYNLLMREAEDGVLDECRASSTAFIPYFPLASGLLTGKVRAGQAPPPGSRLAGKAIDAGDVARVERMIAIAAQHRHTILEAAFGWLLSKPMVATVIAGATSPAQVHANVAAARARLVLDEIEALNAVR